jgi:hypothetical protein
MNERWQTLLQNRTMQEANAVVRYACFFFKYVGLSYVASNDDMICEL